MDLQKLTGKEQSIGGLRTSNTAKSISLLFWYALRLLYVWKILCTLLIRRKIEDLLLGVVDYVVEDRVVDILGFPLFKVLESLLDFADADASLQSGLNSHAPATTENDSYLLGVYQLLTYQL